MELCLGTDDETAQSLYIRIRRQTKLITFHSDTTGLVSERECLVLVILSLARVLKLSSIMLS